MSIEILQDARVHALLLKIDQELARQHREAGCRHCGAKLHRSNFPRKPRGCPESMRELYAKRFSFDCSNCDRRATPPSIRFIDRRLYPAVVLALVCPRGPARRSWLCEKLKVAAATVRRWRRWWQETFVGTARWRLKRADFAPPIDVAALPGSAVQRFDAIDPGDRVVQFLRFLLPIKMQALPM